MSLPIYQRVAVTDAGDVIPGAEYTVINENTGVAAPIYSDRTGATLLTAPYFADSVGTIQFFIAQGTTFRVAASGGVGTYTDRYVYGVAEAVLVQANGNVGIGTSSPATKLDVNGTVTADGLTVDVGATGDAQVEVKGSGAWLRTYSANTAGQGYGGWQHFDNTDALAAGIYVAGTENALRFYNNGSERLRIDSAGHLLVGKTAPDAAVVGSELKADGTAVFSRSSTSATMYVSTLGSDGDIISFRKDGTTVGSIGTLNGDLWMARANGCGVRYITAAWLPTNNVGGDNDNAIDLGLPSVRFDDIYATNGTIQTSDRNEKQDILAITTAESNVAKACKGLLRSFRWIDAVEKKGDDARIHFGIIAQDLQDAFTAEGLDAGRYAMFMSDTWWETQTEVAAVEAVEGVEFVQAVEASEALYSEDGELISEAVEAVEGVEGVEAVEAAEAYTRTDTFQTLAEAPAGATERTRMGVRYTELLAFIIAAL